MTKIRPTRRGARFTVLTRFRLLVMILVFLIGFGLVFGTIGQDEPVEIISVSEAMCTLDLLLAQGSDSTIAGMTGDAETDLVEVMDNGGVLPPGSLATELATHAGMTPANIAIDPDVEVLMIVLDDFTTPSGTRTHGDYVMEVATVAYHSVYNGSNFVIDTADYGTGGNANTVEGAAEALQEAVARNRGNEAYNMLVINMSFVILPCEGSFTADGIDFEVNVLDFVAALRDDNSLEDLDGNGYLTLWEFLLQQQGVEIDQYGVPVINGLADYIAAANDDNALFDTIEDLREAFGEDVLPVASAGNFNFGDDPPRESYAPARWEHVLAASGARADDPGGMWAGSQSGQMKAPAAWHPTITDEYISGTSFAAPMVSVWAGFMSLTGNCNYSSMLGIGKDENLPYINGILSNCP